MDARLRWAGVHKNCAWGIVLLKLTTDGHEAPRALFEPVSRWNTFVGGTCAPPSALLVFLGSEILEKKRSSSVKSVAFIYRQRVRKIGTDSILACNFDKFKQFLYIYFLHKSSWHFSMTSRLRHRASIDGTFYNFSVTRIVKIIRTKKLWKVV